MKRLILEFAAPPKWLFTLLTAVPAAIILYAEAFRASWAPFSFLLAALYGLVLTALWLARLLSFGGIALLARREYPELDRQWQRWFLSPAIVAATTALVYYQVPSQLVFLRSQKALNQFVQDVQRAKPGTYIRPRQVGAYYATNITRSGKNVYFTINDVEGMLSEGHIGLAYSHDGHSKPKIAFPNVVATNFTPINRHWFYAESWEDW